MASTWEREWQLNADDSIMSQEGVTLFKLEKGSVHGMVYYKVDFEDGEMNDAWKGCVFVKRGSKPFVWSGTPLPRWVEDAAGNLPSQAYDEGIAKNLESTNARTNRLEGEIGEPGAEAWVILFLARRAVQRAPGVLADLLIVQHNDKFEWSTSDGSSNPIEDGTGHGDSL